jgi:hypothetical protein
MPLPSTLRQIIDFHFHYFAITIISFRLFSLFHYLLRAPPLPAIGADAILISAADTPYARLLLP